MVLALTALSVLQAILWERADTRGSGRQEFATGHSLARRCADRKWSVLFRPGARHPRRIRLSIDDDCVETRRLTKRLLSLGSDHVRLRRRFFSLFLADRHRINGCAIGARQGADRRPDEPFTPENWSAPDTAEVQRVVAGRIIKPDADST